MLQIGIIGVGDIAKKAYMPVYSALRERAHWLISSRTADKLTQLTQEYGFDPAGTSLDELDALHLDAVMIHTPTPTHYALVKHFLEKGVNVFVDKPLATSMAEIEELYALAAKNDRLLTVGFNRRFVPSVAQLALASNKTMIRVDKNRIDVAEESQHALWDLFIHSVDTALFLAGFPEQVKPRYTFHANDAEQLEQAGVTFTAPGIRAEATINLKAGTNLEEISVATDHGLLRVQNLNQRITFDETGSHQQLADGWENNLVTRGFYPMVEAFVDAVAQGTGHNPVAPATSLQSHALIAQLARQIK